MKAPMLLAIAALSTAQAAEYAENIEAAGISQRV
jgi:hypothetical protein